MGSSGTPATDAAIIGCRLILNLTVVFAVSVLGSAAEAQTVTRSKNSKQSESFQELNPCNLNPMQVEGTAHTQSNEQSSGDISVKQHLNGHAVEIADPTQRYTYQSWQTDRVRSSSATEVTITFSNRKHVIHQGQRRTPLDSSYFQWIDMTTHPDGNITIKRSTAECKQQ